MSAEGMAHDQDHQSGAVNLFGPLLDHGCTQGSQIVEEVTIALEYGPSAPQSEDRWQVADAAGCSQSRRTENPLEMKVNQSSLATRFG
jgi:hypothetical protein